MKFREANVIITPENYIPIEQAFSTLVAKPGPEANLANTPITMFMKKIKTPFFYDPRFFVDKIWPLNYFFKWRASYHIKP